MSHTLPQVWSKWVSNSSGFRVQVPPAAPESVLGSSDVNFQVTSPDDHLNQFAALGAILAAPLPNGRYLVYRNLTQRPLHIHSGV